MNKDLKNRHRVTKYGVEYVDYFIKYMRTLITIYILQARNAPCRIISHNKPFRGAVQFILNQPLLFSVTNNNVPPSGFDIAEFSYKYLINSANQEIKSGDEVVMVYFCSVNIYLDLLRDSDYYAKGKRNWSCYFNPSAKSYNPEIHKYVLDEFKMEFPTLNLDFFVTDENELHIINRG